MARRTARLTGSPVRSASCRTSWSVSSSSITKLMVVARSGSASTNVVGTGQQVHQAPAGIPEVKGPRPAQPAVAHCRHQADVWRPLQAGRPDRPAMPRRRLRQPLGDRVRRRHRPGRHEPGDLGQVGPWMCTRFDPREDIKVLRGSRSTTLDPMAYSYEDPRNARVVIGACKPWRRAIRFRSRRGQQGAGCAGAGGVRGVFAEEAVRGAAVDRRWTQSALSTTKQWTRPLRNLRSGRAISIDLKYLEVALSSKLAVKLSVVTWQS